MASQPSSEPSFIPTPPYKKIMLMGSPSIRVSEEGFRQKSDPDINGFKYYFLLGPTGSGKSAFIQALAGKETSLGISKDGLEGVTQEVICYELVDTRQPCELHPAGDRIRIVDTPGFADNTLSETKVLNMLHNWVVKNHAPTPSVNEELSPSQAQTFQNVKVLKSTVMGRILYFHPITLPRMSNSQRRLLELLALLVANPNSNVKNKLQSVWIVTSMWDTVQTTNVDKMDARFEELKGVDGPFKDFVANGSDIHKFWNSRESALSILDAPRSLKSESGSSIFDGHAFHFERMYIKKRRLADTPYGRPLYRMLCERIGRLVDEKAIVSAMIPEQKEGGEHSQYWTEQSVKVEAQLNAYRQDLEDFGPAPDDSVISLQHLFDDNVDAAVSFPSSPSVSDADSPPDKPATPPHPVTQVNEEDTPFASSAEHQTGHFIASLAGPALDSDVVVEQPSASSAAVVTEHEAGLASRRSWLLKGRLNKLSGLPRKVVDKIRAIWGRF